MWGSEQLQPSVLLEPKLSHHRRALQHLWFCMSQWAKVTELLSVQCWSISCYSLCFTWICVCSCGNVRCYISGTPGTKWQLGITDSIARLFCMYCICSGYHTKSCNWSWCTCKGDISTMVWVLDHMNTNNYSVCPCHAIQGCHSTIQCFTPGVQWPPFTFCHISPRLCTSGWHMT